MTRPRPTIGDVAVIRGEPPFDDDGNRNPYRGESVLGDERFNALHAYVEGGDTSAYTFWYAPVFGGAYRIKSVEDVNWSGLRPRSAAGR